MDYARMFSLKVSAILYVDHTSQLSKASPHWGDRGVPSGTVGMYGDSKGFIVRVPVGITLEQVVVRNLHASTSMRLLLASLPVAMPQVLAACLIGSEDR